MTRVHKAVLLARQGHFGALLRRLRNWLWRDVVALGLEYDPRVPVQARLPRLPIEMRPIEPDDVHVFVAPPPPETQRSRVAAQVTARELIDSGLQTCYVGVTDDGPVYMQFLVTTDQNDKLAAVFDRLFPPLVGHEGLLEFAFTLKEQRTRPVMPSALIRLLEIAAQRGLTRVMTYVPAGHDHFVRFFIRLGFVPFAARIEKYRFLRRKVEFRPLDRELAEPLIASPDIESAAASTLL